MTGRLEQFAAGLVERQRTVHERVACPHCGALVGERCHRAGQRPSPVVLKHPHRQRLAADGSPLR